MVEDAIDHGLGARRGAGCLVGAVAHLARARVVLEALERDGVTRAILLIYAIGYKGLRQPEVFRYETAEHQVPRAAAVTLPASAAAENRPRYERSGLDPDEAIALKAAILDVMEREAPWRNPDLTLADLASRLGTTSHKLSEVLNSKLRQTFYDLVNSYRVKEVQRRIADGDATRSALRRIQSTSGGGALCAPTTTTRAGGASSTV